MARDGTGDRGPARGQFPAGRDPARADAAPHRARSRRRAAWLRLALAGLLAVAIAGCGRRPGPAVSSSKPAPATPAAGRVRSQAFIDAGNEAYRSADYELALKRYAAAAVADPRDPAAYFGMGMTFTRLKREDEARAAFARAQQLSVEERSPRP